MLFSKLKWTIADVMPVSAGLTFDKMKTSLNDADDIYIRPLLGKALMTDIEGFFEAESKTEEQAEVLRLAQSAEAYLAFYHNFHELSVRITDQGFQRQDTENFSGAYKYQERELRNSFAEKGFLALDNLMNLLDENAETFTSWTSAPAYRKRKNSIVKSTQEVNDIYDIDNSYIIFLRLLREVNEIEMTTLPYILGVKLYDKFKEAVVNDTETIENAEVEELRRRVVKYLVYEGLAQMVRRSGSITSKGLYFESVDKTSDNGEKASPAERGRAHDLARNLSMSAQAFKNLLIDYVSVNVPEDFGGRPSQTFNRDNDGKHMFFA